MRSTRSRASTGAAALALLVLLLLAPSVQATTASAVQNRVQAPRPALAPTNPAFVVWQAMGALEPVFRAANPHGLGLRPSPTLGYTLPAGEAPASSGVAGAFPSSYDLRTLGKLPPVRDQGAFGTCWTFAALGSVESSSLPGESLDLSEDNVALTSGFDMGGATTPADKYDAGGNLDMATAYLARWGGPVWETDDAYGDSVTPGGLAARRHIQNVDVYAGRTSATDNDRIKTAVSTYGATYVSMWWTDASYNSTTKSYYYSGTDNTNHAVLVVGWDDNYAASKFSPAAPGNGAFIVRNSWGSNWGTSGYFYVSYYDGCFATEDAATFEAAQPATNYEKVYQYDPLGRVGDMASSWGANAFTATATSTLGAVAFYANAPNTAYEIWEGPSTASLTRLTSGTMAQMGYHTVAVPAGTTLTSGARFVVAVKLSTPGYKWPLSIEYPATYYSDDATAAPGQSYYSSDGTTWYDLTSYRANANACIKAFASAVSSVPTSTSSYGFAADATSGWMTDAMQVVTVNASGGAGTDLTIHFSQDGGASWSLIKAGTHTAPLTSQGAHHIEYYASDSLATEPVHDAGWVNIDSVAPVTEDDHLTASLFAPATITLTPTDATSGVTGGLAKTEYAVDGAAGWSTGTAVVLGEGTHTVAYRSTDKAGNVEAPDKTFTVTVVASLTPMSACDYVFSPDAAGGWKNRAQQFTVTAAGGSGSGRTIHYSLDGGATWSTSGLASVDVPVTTDGAHRVQYYADDSLARESTHDAGWINIDTGVPSTRAGKAGVRRGAKVTLKYRVADPAQGCGKAVVKLQIRKRSKVVKTIALGTRATNAALSYRYRARLKPGTYTWRMLATDLAGNVAVKVTSARLVIR